MFRRVAGLFNGIDYRVYKYLPGSMQKSTDIAAIHRELGEYLTDHMEGIGEENAAEIISLGADVNPKRCDHRGGPLFAAVRYKRVNIVRMLVAAGANVDGVLNCPRAPLVAAALADDKSAEMTKILLDAGADIEKRTDDATAILAAAFKGNEVAVKMLLDAGANVNALGYDGFSALIFATAGGHESIVNMLINAGADLNARMSDKHTAHNYTYGGDTALIVAIRKGATSIADMLIGAGADVNARNSSNLINPVGNTALDEAISKRDVSMVQKLIDAGATIGPSDTYVNSFLITAAAYANAPLVQMLIKAGADVNVSDRAGTTPLMKASGHGNTVIAKMLINAGADVNARNKIGNTALGFGALYPEIVDLLTNAGAVANAPTASTTTLTSTTPAAIIDTALADAGIDDSDDPVDIDPRVYDFLPEYMAGSTDLTAIRRALTDRLIEAIKGTVVSDEATVASLIDLGVNVNRPNENGDPPLTIAAAIGSVGNILMLLKAGANVNALSQSSGRRPLTIAIMWDRPDVVQILLDAGAYVGPKKASNFSPIMIAAMSGQVDIVEALINAGASNGHAALGTALAVAERLRTLRRYPPMRPSSRQASDVMEDVMAGI